MKHILCIGALLFLSTLSVNAQTRCGLLNDTAMRLPSAWETFAPPAVGQSYVDPAFGCTVTRITNAAIDETLWDGSRPAFMNHYSTWSALNSNDTLILVASNDGWWRIRRIDGGVAVTVAAMPLMNNGHPVWDATDPAVFYYALGNTLFRGRIVYIGTSAGTVGTVTTVVERAFTEYSGIVSPDSADLSQDGSSIALVGKNANSTMDIFVWNLATLTKTSTYRTVCTISTPIVNTNQPGCLHKLQLTANNLLSIQFASDGSGNEQGVRLWSAGALVKLQNGTSHYDTGYDLTGNSTIIGAIGPNSLPGAVDPCVDQWQFLGSYKIANPLGQGAICLLDHLPSWHISYRGGPAQPYAAVSFFDSRTTGPERFNNHPSYQAPSVTNWALYEDEIVLARVDGKATYRVAHARSRSIESYGSQPHATISRSGRFAVFTSNMAYPNGCPPGMHVSNDCTDVYVVNLIPTVAPPPPPPPLPPTNFNCHFTVPGAGGDVTVSCSVGP